MGPLDLALAGSSIFQGVGGAVDGGKEAGKSGDLSAMRSKEYVSGALVLVTGAVIAWREKAMWPMLIAVGVIGLLVVLHEYHAKQNLPAPDVSTMIGRMK